MSVILDTVSIKSTLLNLLNTNTFVPWTNGIKNNRTSYYELEFPEDTDFSSYNNISNACIKLINTAVLDETIKISKISKNINKIPYLLNAEWFHKEQLSNALCYYFYAICNPNIVSNINLVSSVITPPLLFTNRFTFNGMLSKQNTDGVTVNPKDASSGDILYPIIPNAPYAYRFPFSTQIWSDLLLDDNTILLIDDDLFNLKDSINECSIFYSYKNKWVLQLPLIYNSTDLHIIFI